MPSDESHEIPRGKAHGPDLPGELCHHHPALVARLLYPLLLKVLLHGNEPLSFKGGLLLTPAFKGKGPADNCRSYRSLLVSNHLGKAVHRTIRQHYAPLYKQFMQAQQTGGRRKTPAQLPQHQVRAFARHAKLQGHSTGILYLDLVEAFYRVLREVPMGGEVSDELVAHVMNKMNMPPDALHDIHALLQEPTSLERAGLPVCGQGCFRAIHCSTHFWLRDQGDITRTRMGSRPVDSFADVIFGYMWSIVLQKLENHLVEQHIIMPMTSHEQLPLIGREFLHGEPAYFLGPTWMEDLALCVCDSLQGEGASADYGQCMWVLA